LPTHLQGGGAEALCVSDASATVATPVAYAFLPERNELTVIALTNGQEATIRSAIANFILDLGMILSKSNAMRVSLRKL
jgi:hypothetical protein